MSLSELEKSGRIRRIPVDPKQVGDLIGVAKRDLAVAEKLLAENLDWSFIISYNAMLQASRAFMFSHGFTAGEEEHHKTVVEFMRAVLGDKEKELVSMLDRMRRKRHNVTYDEAGMVSEYEAKAALAAAKNCMAIVESRIREKLKR